MRYLIAFLTAVLAGPLAHAEFTTGIGYFSHHINEVTSTDDAKKNLAGTTYFPLIARYNTQAFWGSIFWAPYLEFTHLTTLIVKNETPDGTTKRNFAIVGSPLIYPVGEAFFLSGGPSFMYYELKGKGGTKTVNNGTGTTVFGVPSKTRTSKLFMLEIGAGWQLTDWRIGLDLYLSGLASERLATSFQASFTYAFGGRTW